MYPDRMPEQQNRAGMPRVNTRPDNPGALVEDTQDSPDAEMQHLPVRMDGM